MNIFDILGPVMVGPSSSHTAGAVRIGLITRKLLGEDPVEVEIDLHGSFAATGVGHGTDKALIAGLLGMETDDIEIPNSFELAKERGLKFSFDHKEVNGAHPNTTILYVTGVSGKKLKVQACSIGGGRILVNEIDDIVVNLSGEKPTLIIHNEDRPGQIAEVTRTLAGMHINIATMHLYRNQKGGIAVMVLEMDQRIKEETVEKLRQLDGIVKVTYLNTDN